MDEKPRTPTARKQPTNKHAFISLIRQMGLHCHYKGTPPIHKLATIFRNSRNWGAHTQLPNIRRISLNSAMTSDRRAVCFTTSPRRASTASSGSGSGGGTWINVTQAGRTLLRLLCSYDRLQDVLQGGQENRAHADVSRAIKNKVRVRLEILPELTEIIN
jgi:hypothetical protein